MKNCLLVLIAGVMLSVPLGCNAPSDEEALPYDRDTDGLPVAFHEPMADYEIIDNPEAVRERRARLRDSDGSDSGDGGDGALTGPETEASEDEINEAKAVVERVFAAQGEDDKSVAWGYFDEDAVTALQTLMPKRDALVAKCTVLDATMRDKFDADYLESVKMAVSDIPAKTKCPKSAAELLGDQGDEWEFSKIGEKIVGKNAQGRKFVFSNTTGGWKVGFDADSRKLVAAYAEAVDAATNMVDTAKVGVDDGTITASGSEAKMAELQEQMFDPAMQKLDALLTAPDSTDDTTTDPTGDTTTDPTGDTTTTDTTTDTTDTTDTTTDTTDTTDTTTDPADSGAGI